jgi:hypothetical protein
MHKLTPAAAEFGVATLLITRILCPEAPTTMKAYGFDP